MKLTKALVKAVQNDIDRYGLETALYNVLWLQATQQLNEIGVKRVRTSDKEKR